MRNNLLVRRSHTHRTLIAVLTAIAALRVSYLAPAFARAEHLQKQHETVASSEQLQQQGIVLYQSNRPAEAIQVWQQALRAHRESRNAEGESRLLGNIGVAYRAMGDYAKAIEYYQQALTISQTLNNRHRVRRVLGNLGNVYAIIGQYRQALEYQHSSLNAARELQDTDGESIALANLGAAYADQGDHDAAIGYYQESLALSKQVGDRTSEASVLCNLGSAYNIWKKDHALAVEYYQDCLATARAAGDRWMEAEALSSLGFAYEGLQSFETALTHYEDGLTLFREIDSLQSAATTLNNRAHTLMTWNQVNPEPERLQLAKNDLRQSIEILERVRANLVADADRVSLFDTQVATYNLLQQVLIAQGQPEAALIASEEGRSRAFATLLAEDHSQPPSKLDLSAIRQFAQENNATLVEYALVPDDDFIHQGRAKGEAEALYIWVVSPTGNVDFQQVNLKEKGITLSHDVQQSLSAIGIRSRGGLAPAGSNETSHTEQLQKLHEVLIAPIADYLPKDPTAPVIFVPQGELFLVPFAALTDADGTYLIEQHTLLSAPSIQVLQLAKKPHNNPLALANLAGEDFLIVGNPDMPTIWEPRSNRVQQLQNLPGAEAEAKAVGSLFGNAPLLNQQATEAAVRARFAEARVVHLATHGLLEYGNPEDSGVSDVPGAIALTPDDQNDGLLTAAEISTLSLTADLVVLSACDTGLGQVTGDGVIGLSRSLLGAGAANVVVSLWAVPDAPTATLMSAFYEQMQQGKSKAQALREAMLLTLKENPAPSDWAAFTLIGQTD
ncbi:MAG: CHAT domain-containing tetratricopeptide repeat protein [Cyanobacteria bacterium P01_A01_bin.116]